MERRAGNSLLRRFLVPGVFALHAGPYSSWKSDANGIPIRLFARKSLAEFVDHEEWLKVTRQGLDFYGTYFGFTYPFVKYDQVIVPDLREERWKMWEP